jgi:hypothetical protein
MSAFVGWVGSAGTGRSLRSDGASVSQVALVGKQTGVIGRCALHADMTVPQFLDYLARHDATRDLAGTLFHIIEARDDATLRRTA